MGKMTLKDLDVREKRAAALPSVAEQESVGASRLPHDGGAAKECVPISYYIGGTTVISGPVHLT